MSRDHWNNVYENADATELGWYDPDLAQSLRLIDRRGLSTDDLVIDVGAGTSSLIHSLLDRGYHSASASTTGVTESKNC